MVDNQTYYPGQPTDFDKEHFYDWRQKYPVPTFEMKLPSEKKTFVEKIEDERKKESSIFDMVNPESPFATTKGDPSFIPPPQDVKKKEEEKSYSFIDKLIGTKEREDTAQTAQTVNQWYKDFWYGKGYGVNPNINTVKDGVPSYAKEFKETYGYDWKMPSTEEAMDKLPWSTTKNLDLEQTQNAIYNGLVVPDTEGKLLYHPGSKIPAFEIAPDGKTFRRIAYSEKSPALPGTYGMVTIPIDLNEKDYRKAALKSGDKKVDAFEQGLFGWFTNPPAKYIEPMYYGVGGLTKAVGIGIGTAGAGSALGGWKAGAAMSTMYNAFNTLTSPDLAYQPPAGIAAALALDAASSFLGFKPLNIAPNFLPGTKGVFYQAMKQAFANEGASIGLGLASGIVQNIADTRGVKFDPKDYTMMAMMGILGSLGRVKDVKQLTKLTENFDSIRQQFHIVQDVVQNLAGKRAGVPGTIARPLTADEVMQNLDMDMFYKHSDAIDKRTVNNSVRNAVDGYLKAMEAGMAFTDIKFDILKKKNGDLEIVAVNAPEKAKTTATSNPGPNYAPASQQASTYDYNKIAKSINAYSASELPADLEFIKYLKEDGIIKPAKGKVKEGQANYDKQHLGTEMTRLVKDFYGAGYNIENEADLFNKAKAIYSGSAGVPIYMQGNPDNMLANKKLSMIGPNTSLSDIDPDPDIATSLLSQLRTDAAIERRAMASRYKTALLAQNPAMTDVQMDEYLTEVLGDLTKFKSKGYNGDTKFNQKFKDKYKSDFGKEADLKPMKRLGNIGRDSHYQTDNIEVSAPRQLQSENDTPGEHFVVYPETGMRPPGGNIKKQVEKSNSDEVISATQAIGNNPNVPAEAKFGISTELQNIVGKVNDINPIIIDDDPNKIVKAAKQLQDAVDDAQFRLEFDVPEVIGIYDKIYRDLDQVIAKYTPRTTDGINKSVEESAGGGLNKIEQIKQAKRQRDYDVAQSQPQRVDITTEGDVSPDVQAINKQYIKELDAKGKKRVAKEKKDAKDKHNQPIDLEQATIENNIDDIYPFFKDTWGPVDSNVDVPAVTYTPDESIAIEGLRKEIEASEARVASLTKKVELAAVTGDKVSPSELFQEITNLRTNSDKIKEIELKANKRGLMEESQKNPELKKKLHDAAITNEITKTNVAKKKAGSGLSLSSIVVGGGTITENEDDGSEWDKEDLMTWGGAAAALVTVGALMFGRNKVKLGAAIRSGKALHPTKPYSVAPVGGDDFKTSIGILNRGNPNANPYGVSKLISLLNPNGEGFFTFKVAGEATAGNIITVELGPSKIVDAKISGTTKSADVVKRINNKLVKLYGENASKSKAKVLGIVAATNADIHRELARLMFMKRSDNKKLSEIALASGQTSTEYVKNKIAEYKSDDYLREALMRHAKAQGWDLDADEMLSAYKLHRDVQNEITMLRAGTILPAFGLDNRDINFDFTTEYNKAKQEVADYTQAISDLTEIGNDAAAEKVAKFLAAARAKVRSLGIYWKNVTYSSDVQYVPSDMNQGSYEVRLVQVDENGKVDNFGGKYAVQTGTIQEAEAVLKKLESSIDLTPNEDGTYSGYAFDINGRVRVDKSGQPIVTTYQYDLNNITNSGFTNKQTAINNAATAALRNLSTGIAPELTIASFTKELDSAAYSELGSISDVAMRDEIDQILKEALIAGNKKDKEAAFNLIFDAVNLARTAFERPSMGYSTSLYDAQGGTILNANGKTSAPTQRTMLEPVITLTKNVSDALDSISSLSVQWEAERQMKAWTNLGLSNSDRYYQFLLERSRQNNMGKDNRVNFSLGEHRDINLGNAIGSMISFSTAFDMGFTNFRVPFVNYLASMKDFFIAMPFENRFRVMMSAILNTPLALRQANTSRALAAISPITTANTQAKISGKVLTKEMATNPYQVDFDDPNISPTQKGASLAYSKVRSSIGHSVFDFYNDNQALQQFNAFNFLFSKYSDGVARDAQSMALLDNYMRKNPISENASEADWREWADQASTHVVRIVNMSNGDFSRFGTLTFINDLAQNDRGLMVALTTFTKPGMNAMANNFATYRAIRYSHGAKRAEMFARALADQAIGITMFGYKSVWLVTEALAVASLFNGDDEMKSVQDKKILDRLEEWTKYDTIEFLSSQGIAKEDAESYYYYAKNIMTLGMPSIAAGGNLAMEESFTQYTSAYLISKSKQLMNTLKLSEDKMDGIGKVMANYAVFRNLYQAWQIQDQGYYYDSKGRATNMLDMGTPLENPLGYMRHIAFGEPIDAIMKNKNAYSMANPTQFDTERGELTEKVLNMPTLALSNTSMYKKDDFKDLLKSDKVLKADIGYVYHQFQSIMTDPEFMMPYDNDREVAGTFIKENTAVFRKLSGIDNNVEISKDEGMKSLQKEFIRDVDNYYCGLAMSQAINVRNIQSKHGVIKTSHNLNYTNAEGKTVQFVPTGKHDGYNYALAKLQSKIAKLGTQPVPKKSSTKKDKKEYNENDYMNESNSDINNENDYMNESTEGMQ